MAVISKLLFIEAPQKINEEPKKQVVTHTHTNTRTPQTKEKKTIS